MDKRTAFTISKVLDAYDIETLLTDYAARPWVDGATLTTQGDEFAPTERTLVYGIRGESDLEVLREAGLQESEIGLGWWYDTDSNRVHFDVVALVPESKPHLAQYMSEAELEFCILTMNRDTGEVEARCYDNAGAAPRIALARGSWDDAIAGRP